MTTPSLTLYKLIILYMLRRIQFSMTLAQISDFVLGKGYTDYFNLQSSLSELVDAGLAHADVIRNSTYYAITPEGEEAIGYFESRLDPKLREDIVAYLRENRMKIRNETAVLADYRRTADGEFLVICRVRERDKDLIELRLAVPERFQAELITDRWKDRSDAVYTEIMQTLLLEDVQEDEA